MKTFRLKQEFKETDFYKNLYIALNEKIDNPNRRKTTLDEIRKDFAFEDEIHSLSITEQELVLEDINADITKYQNKIGDKITIKKCLKDFDYHIFRKAIAMKSKADTAILQFQRLKDELQIDSIDDLLQDDFL